MLDKSRRLVVGISGASGAILGIRLLEILRDLDVETHLVITTAARHTIQSETSWQVTDVVALADAVYEEEEIGARIASGSFPCQGMIVMPCSIKSLSAIANSYTDSLLVRAADVTLKEGRPLILAVRETPLHRGHLRLMDLAARAGAILYPPIPAFYTHPQSIDELVNHYLGRVLTRVGIQNDLYTTWDGMDILP
jgi:4-hydroxy-3-polyprenylbenzoate decarboxylase